jgi:hypothetical protein
VHDPRPGLMALTELEGRLVAREPLGLREREMNPFGVVPAPPAGRIMVRGYLYRSPPRSKCAR